MDETSSGGECVHELPGLYCHASRPHFYAVRFFGLFCHCVFRSVDLPGHDIRARNDPEIEACENGIIPHEDLCRTSGMRRSSGREINCCKFLKMGTGH